MNYFNHYFELPELDTLRYARLFDDYYRTFDRYNDYCSSPCQCVKCMGIDDDVRAVSNDLRRAMIRYADCYR